MPVENLSEFFSFEEKCDRTKFRSHSQYCPSIFEKLDIGLLVDTTKYRFMKKIIFSIIKKSYEIQTCNDHMFETGTYSWGAITRIFFLPIVLGLSPNLCAFSIFVRTFWSKNRFIANEKYFLRSNNFTKRVFQIIIDNNIIAEESLCF